MVQYHAGDFETEENVRISGIEIAKGNVRRYLLPASGSGNNVSQLRSLVG